MAGKITAHFGADVSEVESEMLKATRATKAYERAVKGISSADAGSGLARNLDKTNSLFGEISKKFTGGKILESVLGGVGLGGGFQIAEKAAELISSYWKDAAESAERIATASDRATDFMMKRIGLRETDEQALKKAQMRADRANKALAVGSDDPEQQQKLIADAQEAAYNLEVLQKKQREKEKQARDKEADEAKKRTERDMQLKMDAFERVRQQEEKEAAAKKQLEEEAKRERERIAKEEEARQKELAQLRYDRAWKFATNEQKIAQVIKEGKEAQAKYDADKSTENLIQLEKVRAKYIELMDTINGKKDSSNSATETGDGGRIVRGVKVSAEDAARTDATKARNARLERDTMRGRIRDAGRVGSVEKGNKTDELLQQIRDSLKPKTVK